jgi:NAD(P)-dependent dehydrogenase (short-subunit alcohol dehydrogenase family)
MVKITSIDESNARFASEHHAGLICVFVGATSGIGASTLESMANILESSTFYVLGRSETSFVAQKARVESLNSSIKILFIKAEVSLLSEIDAACQRIRTVERKIDILYMSQGCVPLNGPVCASSSILFLLRFS